MNKLITITPPFQPGEGFCWLVSLPPEAQSGDTATNPNQSGLILFEGEIELGPAHTLHDEIRRLGTGRFSHWQDNLYFSTSDNTDPNINGRRYQIYLRDITATPVATQELSTRVGLDETLLLAAIRENINQNDRAFYNLLHCYRLIRRQLDWVDGMIKDKVILEIGASAEPGLPLVLLFSGAACYYANNIIPVFDHLTEAYARLVYLILSGLMPHDPVPWMEICLDEHNTAGQSIAHLRPEKFIPLSPIPAEEINLPENSVDLVFSFSVLEHVKQPKAVIRNMFRLLKPGGLAIHGIDLRDHTNFSQPLNFLFLSEEDYLRKTPASENRWRASDFSDCFVNEGFELLEHRFRDSELQLTASGKTDNFESVMFPFEMLLPKKSFEAILPWVTADMKNSFDPMFQTKSLADLSILVMGVIARKP